MSRPVLVTGGAGYIGSHAAKALARAGALPVSLDNLGRGFAEAVRWGPLEIGDVADRAFLDAVFRRHRPQAVLHFAAFAYVGESMAKPAEYYRNNVAGSLALIEAARAHGVGAFVFSSSCATYGPAAAPITEDTPQQPVNPYGASKLMIERMLSDFSQAYAMRSVSLRYFNAAGADPDGEIGENHDPETHLVPLAIDAALGHGPPLKIFGSDWPTPDGTCIRDYIHVADLAEAHVQALAYLETGGATTALNLGTGTGLSVREIVAAVASATGRPVPEEAAPRRPGDVAALVADATRAAAVLGWRPRRSDLGTIVASAVAWARRRHHRPS